MFPQLSYECLISEKHVMRIKDMILEIMFAQWQVLR